MTRAPHFCHQIVSRNICSALQNWSEASRLGETIPTPGLVFGEANAVIPDDAVIPDVVWISHERLAQR